AAVVRRGAVCPGRPAWLSGGGGCGYFAIGTWVIAEVFSLLTLNGTDLGVDLGGGVGVTFVSAAQLEREYRANGTYWWALAAGAGSVLLVYVILRSRIGLALAAIRDDEAAARS